MFLKLLTAGTLIVAMVNLSVLEDSQAAIFFAILFVGFALEDGIRDIIKKLDEE